MQRDRGGWLVFTLGLALTLVLSACGGGGGGGGGGFGLNGAPVSGSVSTTSLPATYTFNAVIDTPYTVSTAISSGDIVLSVYSGSATTGTLIGWSWNGSSALDTVSFIATVTGPITVVVQHASTSVNSSSYSLQAVSGELTIGATKTASTYNEPINYSFNAVSGTAYRVRLAPQSGNVNIGSVNAKMTASVGSSTLAGTAVDTVTFVAAGSQRYYVRVDPTSVDSTYDIRVDTTTADPDLQAAITSAVSDGVNVTVGYTVTNKGLSAAGAFGVALWSDAATAPTVGATGQSSATYASLAAGASVSGTAVIPNAANSGTAYAIVDTVNAVVESDEANNVSAGRPWQKPLIAPQTFDFQSGSISAAMVMSGNAAWAIDAANGSASTQSLKAGAIGNSQSSCVALTVTNAGSVKFDYAVSSESGWDYLRFYIDGVQQGAWSGTVNWTPSSSFAVNSGVHEYKWCYAKDSTGVAGSDTAWIDNIVFTQAGVDLQVTINSAVSNGTNVTVSYTANNAGNTAAGSFAVDVWSNAASAPLVGAAGQGTATHASLAAGASVTGTVTIADAGASGTAYAIADTLNMVVEVNEANNASAGQAWVAPPTVAAPVTYDFEDGLVPSALVMSGNAAWVNAAGGAGGSTRSLKAGTITHSQTTCTTIYATGSSSVSFDYSVSSEATYDFLRFYIDGVQKQSWSGTIAWTSTGVIAAGTTGSHEYKWCYTKDNIISSGSDTAWIDNIVIN